MCSFFGAYSQTKEESVKELMLAMRQEEIIDKSFSSVLPAIQKQMEEQLGHDQTKKSEELYKYTMQVAADMAKSMVNNDLAAIYDKLFSHAEIIDLITFYRTPTGQKTLSMMPEMQKQIMSVMISKYMPDMQEKIRQRTLQLKEKN